MIVWFVYLLGYLFILSLFQCVFLVNIKKVTVKLCVYSSSAHLIFTVSWRCQEAVRSDWLASSKLGWAHSVLFPQGWSSQGCDSPTASILLRDASRPRTVPISRWGNGHLLTIVHLVGTGLGFRLDTFGLSGSIPELSGLWACIWGPRSVWAV